MIEPNFIDSVLDLNVELIKHPASTFYARVSGDSMQDANICNGDILVIDKSLEPQSGDTAVCCLGGEFTLKFIDLQPDCIRLIPANKGFEVIEIPIEDEYNDNFIIWGIVTHCIHKCSR